jgi:hypothetical protein
VPPPTSSDINISEKELSSFITGKRSYHVYSLHILFPQLVSLYLLFYAPVGHAKTHPIMSIFRLYSPILLFSPAS